MSEEPKRRCFVIMPFSETTEKHTEEYWNKHYAEFLKPLIESHPLVAHRSAPLRGDILRQIITDLVTVPIVIADLTDANPNVYWELGVRQSFRHCTVTIAEHGTRLPFDLGAKGTLYYYPSNHIKMRQFEKDFSAAIDDCLKNPGSPDSHVLETISGRGTLFQILMKEESSRKLDALLTEIKSNKDLLDSIKTTCENNPPLRKENKTIKVETTRLRTVSVEAILVNRYLDADSRFYMLAALYLDVCVATNGQLSAWDYADTHNVEKWFLKNFDTHKETFTYFEKLVTEQKQRLSQLV